jgi:hypothetical protein
MTCRWLPAALALASPPPPTYMCIQLALAIDRLRLGPPWQLIVVFLVGPGAIACGVLGAVAAGELVCPGSRIGRAAIIVAGLVLSVAVWALVDPVKGWK